jgi:hypothetical protein
MERASDRARPGLWPDVVFPVFFEGLSWAQAAGRTGLSENGLRSRFERARPSLRASLASYVDHDGARNEGLNEHLDHRSALLLHRSEHGESTHEVNK